MGARPQSPLQTALDQQREEALDDILSRWHHWQLGAKVGRGHADRSLVAGEYRSPPRYNGEQDADEAIDEMNEAHTMRTVQACVDAMPGELRPACYMMARNAYVGASVFRGRPLNASVTVAARIRAEARGELMRRLVGAGVIE